MKNLLKSLLILAVMSLSVPSHANVTSTTVTPTTMTDSNETGLLMNRLNEIQAMDKSTMTASEKKGLRKELRSIKKAQSTSGGVYLSVGAIIIIILLLIILL